MTTDKAEMWLMKESEGGNAMARSYLLLLKDATPEIKNHWMQQLTTMLEVVDMLGSEIEKINRMEK